MKCIVTAAALLCALPLRAQSGLPLEKVKLPPGFEIRLYARVPGARSMTLGPTGTLFVGTRDEGGPCRFRWVAGKRGPRLAWSGGVSGGQRLGG